jgi:hypothetical protein
VPRAHAAARTGRSRRRRTDTDHCEGL